MKDGRESQSQSLDLACPLSEIRGRLRHFPLQEPQIGDTAWRRSPPAFARRKFLRSDNLVDHLLNPVRHRRVVSRQLRDVSADQETMENRADLAVTRLSVSNMRTARAAKDRMRNDFVPASQAIRP
jgi:hypothetical protein